MEKIDKTRLRNIETACLSIAQIYGFDFSGTGAYEKWPMNHIEYVLHELGHAVQIFGSVRKIPVAALTGNRKAADEAMHEKITEMNDYMRDGSEAEAVAIELNVARRLCLPISARALLSFSRKNNQRRWMPETWKRFVKDRMREDGVQASADEVFRLVSYHLAKVESNTEGE